MSPDREIPLLTGRHISKRFGTFTANDDINFDIHAGEIHALLGENGAGKSTFVKLVYGLLSPDEGQFLWHGAPVEIRSPQAARDMGIGMVFQHFSLFDVLSVAENIQLALPAGISLSEVKERVITVSAEYGMTLSPDARVGDLSVGEQQRVEILRCLLQNPSLLILDEPTSVLTPQEADQLFAVLRRLRDDGCAILFISHKLDEIKALTSKATILRAGKKVTTCDSASTSAKELAELMVGAALDNSMRTPPVLHKGADSLFCVAQVSRPAATAFATALQDISLSVMSGEILGIAGIAGNGQTELMEVLSGEAIGDVTAGKIEMDGVSVAGLGPDMRRQKGMRCVPEERTGHGAIINMSLSENALLTASHEPDNVSASGLVSWVKCHALSRKIIGSYDVRTPHHDPLAGSLSGGNLQKFMIGREMMSRPRLLIVAQPTWGVDIGAAQAIRAAMRTLLEDGTAIIIISQDLEELLVMSHRICVLNQGQLSEPLPAQDVTAESIGLMMGGITNSVSERAV